MKKKFLVGKCYNYCTPTVVEEFNNRIDAESYASLMCRTKEAKYTVLEVVSEWDGRKEEVEL